MNFLTLDDGREKLFQWDTGRIATVTLEEVNEVHFANLKYGKSFTVEIENGKAIIPDEVLQTGEPIYCWAYVGTVSSGYTYKEQFFVVKKRPKPADYVYTPTEIQSFENLAKEVKEIIPVEVENALEEAKASGDFKGDKGDKGEKGDPGEKGEPGTAVADDEMSDESENPVQNKVAKAYIDEKTFKILKGEEFESVQVWKLTSGIYMLDNLDGTSFLCLDLYGKYRISDGILFVADVPSFEYKAIYAFGFDNVDYEQNIVAILVDGEGNIQQDMSAGIFINERMQALESAIADLALTGE
jgi:hypothetical protein